MKSIVFLIIGLILPIFLQNILMAQEQFSASVAKINITPINSQKMLGYAARKSDSVRDSLYHRIVILNDGVQKFILVSSDLARVSPAYYDAVAKKIEKKYGVASNNFWWTFTHTHAAPEVGPSGVIPLFFIDSDRYIENYDVEYTDFVENSLMDGISTALNKLFPAKLGVGWGYSRANVNRRAKDIDNNVFFGENPDGSIDRKIGLLRLEDDKGNPIALIANYPIHGTVLPTTDTRISGDVPGVVSEYVEEKVGAPLLFINGAEGNIAPHYSVSVGQKTYAKADQFLNQYKVLLGEKILEANNKISFTTSNVTFKTKRLIVETPVREDLASRWPEELKDYLRVTSTGGSLVKFPVSFLNINDDIMIWGTPSELFCDISNYIREKSPFSYTFYFGLTNGSLGYFPTKEEMKLGGYEAKTSPFTIHAEEDLILDVLELMNDND